MHPRSRVHFVFVERTRVTTSTPESPGIPARNGFTAYVGLSPVTGLVCHRRLRIKVLSKPGRADKTSANLTPASGRQDHTILPSAKASLVGVPDIAHKSFDPPRDPLARKTLPRPPHPLPNVCDDRETPLSRAGTRLDIVLIWVRRKLESFCGRGFTD
jgi:hypothetical protein